MGECFLVICFSLNTFRQKEFIPYGFWPPYTHGRIIIEDFNRNGKWDFCLATCIDTLTLDLIFERESVNNYVIRDTIGFYLPIWESGDFDGDGLYDIVCQRGEAKRWWVGISIYESPDSFSYPTQEVWRDTVGQGGVIPIVVFDVDRDGIPEIFKHGTPPPNWIWVYEAFEDNQYDTVCTFSPMIDTFPQSPPSTYAFGDFDGDGLIEFVMGDFGSSATGASYWVYESPANNTYECVAQGYVPTLNVKDCFTVPDADGDGKLEFVVKGFVFDTNPFSAFIFEATGNNTYQIIKSFILSGLVSWDYYGGYSDVGDIDGDCIPEIALEADAWVYLIKSCGNDSFYLWDTLPGNYNGSCVRVTNDLDNNGLNEIVISGNNYTRIYEKTPDVIWFCPVQYDTFWANDTVYPRWKLDETIALDSLRLYWAHPQFGCHLIYEGLPTDTTCQWVVPDTQSNMGNRLWLVVKGNGRYDSTYSPVFYIKRAPGIEEAVRGGDWETWGLEVLPNPFTDKVTIKSEIRSTKSETNSSLQNPKLATLKICDVTGRLVRDFSQVTLNGKCSTVIWNGTDDSGCKLPVGVYFVRLETEGFKKVEKAILLR